MIQQASLDLAMEVADDFELNAARTKAISKRSGAVGVGRTENPPLSARKL
jgi:hypothetical protein